MVHSKNQKTKKMKRSLLLNIMIGILLIGTGAAYAQKATLVPVISNDGTIMRKVSSNGKWAVGYTLIDAIYYKATLWNLETYEAQKLAADDQPAGAFDVTDDGLIVVGCYNEKPAYWMNGTWTELPMPNGYVTGEVHAVTADGSKMAGRAFTPSMGDAYACVWENGELVELNLPEEDKMGDNAYFNEIVSVSNDGNTILGCLNYNILPNRTAFLLQNGEYNMFGAEWYDPDQGGDEYNFYDVLSMSRNGKWVTGDMYYVKEIWTNEYYCPFRYDVENDVVELFADDAEVASFAADDFGNLFGATPLNYPIRSALILKNGYWTSLDAWLLAEYGLSVPEETGYDELGNVFSVSADGKTIIGVAGLTTYNWVLKLDVVTGIDKPAQQANPMKAIVKGDHLLLNGIVSNMKVVSLQGQIVMDRNINGKAAIFNVSQLPAGIYIVSMTDANGNVVNNKVYIGKN